MMLLQSVPNATSFQRSAERSYARLDILRQLREQMRRFLLQQRTASGTNDIGSMTSTFLA
jgi:hypothetical protein